MIGNPPLRWRMPPLMTFSVLLHATLGVLLFLHQQAWPWLLAAFIANHAMLAVAGLWPRSHWLGPNWTALPTAAARRGEIALTIDDGPDPEVTPQVLDLLDRHNVKATFFCIGTLAARYPDLCRDIVARGHAVENHSQRHRHNFSLLGMRGFASEIGGAQETLASITGRMPQFFRAPAGLRNPLLGPVLAKFGLHLASWSRRGFDTRCGDADMVSKRLLQGVRPGAILLLHDGHCARTASGEPVILAVLPCLLQSASAAGLRWVTLANALAADV